MTDELKFPATDEIVKFEDSNRELVQRNDISKVVGSLTELLLSRDELPTLKAKLEEMQVTDQLSYSNVGLEVMHVRSIGKLGESKIRPYLDMVNTVRNSLLQAIKTHETECEAVAKIGADRQAEFNRQERIRTERENREREEANRKKAAAEAEKLKREQAEQAARDKDAKIKEIREALRCKDITKAQAAKMLREAGTEEEAKLAQAAADAEAIKNNPKKETVLPNKTTVAGQRARAPLVYEFVDIDKIPRELLYPNVDQKTGKYKPSDFPRLNQMVKGCATEAEAEAKARHGIKVRRDDRV